MARLPRLLIPPLLLLIFATAPATTRAGALIPGPGEAGYDKTLAKKADDYIRQLHGLITVSLGWGLEAYIADKARRALVDAFIKSGQRDFKKQSGKHPYQVVEAYGEFGDLGMFGGVQVAGDAFRYMVLRDGGGSAAMVAEARAVLLRALDGLHWYHAVTGVPGVIARGLRRKTPAAGDPPLPGKLPALTPLQDSAGNPLPKKKVITWRADNSGKLPFLIWQDDCSKDQIDGYIFGLGAVYDAMHGDSSFPAAKVKRLQADALAIGKSLMKKHVVNAGGQKADLVIMDADGRPTTFHDMSAEEISAGVVFPRPLNGFNALLGAGIIRTLYHITGDKELERFFYQELMDRRAYLEIIEKTVGAMYLSKQTNYSNVNMAFVGMYNLLRYESDSALARRMQRILHKQLYNPGKDRQAAGAKQSFFDVIFAGLGSGGSASTAGKWAVSDAQVSLKTWPPAPYWNTKVENCDKAEIKALSCKAIDGKTTLVLSKIPGRGGSLVAEKPVPMALRPPSNFMWRSDPHNVNGGGGSRLNPGGGFHAAYWLGRLLQHDSDGLNNRAKGMRKRLSPSAVDGGGSGLTDAGAGSDAGGGEAPQEDGCSCRAGSGRAGPAAGILLVLLALYRRRA